MSSASLNSSYQCVDNIGHEGIIVPVDTIFTCRPTSRTDLDINIVWDFRELRNMFVAFKVLLLSFLKSVTVS